MSVSMQILFLILGAILAGTNGLIVWILSDLRGWLKTLNTQFLSHVQDRRLHR